MVGRKSEGGCLTKQFGTNAFSASGGEEGDWVLKEF